MILLVLALVQSDGNPLGGLPGAEGPHAAAIRYLGDRGWIELGRPAPDPAWGRAPGRSWCCTMPFAPALRGAFLYGEGQHGFVKPDGRYMDDLWFYDLNGHRWICVHPGTDAKDPGLATDAEGFPADRLGRRTPVSLAVHAYDLLTFDDERRRLMIMGVHSVASTAFTIPGGTSTSSTSRATAGRTASSGPSATRAGPRSKRSLPSRRIPDPAGEPRVNQGVNPIRAACGAILALAAAAGAQERGRALAPVGPLGYWKGDDAERPGEAADSTGNGYHGKHSAGAAVSTELAPLKIPNAGSIALDGATGVVTVPDAPALRLAGDLTIAFWKRRTANAKDWSRMVGKGNGAQRNYGVWQAPDGDSRILFQIYDPGGRPVIDLWSPAATALNAWVHVVCTVSVNSVALYLNGAPAAHGTRNGEPGTSADPLTFGFAGFHTHWSGQLDDVRIYDRALSMGEIAYLAAGNGPPAPPSGLAAAPDGPHVTLRWTASPTPPPAGTATYYLVKRSATPGSGHVAAGGFQTMTTFTDLADEPGKTWHYVVTAINTGGESTPSNEAAAKSK